MKKLMSVAFAAAMGIALATPAAAKVGVEANGARADGRWGGELGIGYSIGVGGFKLTPSAGTLIYAGDNDRYYEDANGGSRRCRDSSNGQYADSNLCSNTRFRAYGRVEATYAIPKFATIGAGIRVSNEVRPYGTIAFPLAPKLKLKGNGGPRYGALGLTFGY